VAMAEDAVQMTIKTAFRGKVIAKEVQNDPTLMPELLKVNPIESAPPLPSLSHLPFRCTAAGTRGVPSA
jgi:hypothetical protein